MLASEPPSSPPGEDAAPEDSLAWYKSQYEQLETELAEFRVSSEELEKELERDLDAAEKRENALKDKAEGLVFEVDEWKVGSPLPKLCRRLQRVIIADSAFAEEVQGIEDRGERRTERAGKGDHNLEGHKSHAAAQATRHRSCK